MRILLKHLVIFVSITFVTSCTSTNMSQSSSSFSPIQGVIYRIPEWKEYNDALFSLLYKNFSEKPYARYTVTPSFDAEYAFSVETIEGKKYIISNKLSENLHPAGYGKKPDKDGRIKWSADIAKQNVKLNTSKTEISNELYLIIGELFELLANISKDELRTPIIVDGTRCYFETTDKNGEIKMNVTLFSNFDKESSLGRFVHICENLFSLGFGENIDQTKIIEEIILLINDLKK